MGCNTSKLDRLPAVALCRERCKFLDEALRQSYALADAHMAHIHSLNTLSSALLSFFQDSASCTDTSHTTNPQVNGSDDAINDGKRSPPSRSDSSSLCSDDSDSRVLLHSESEPEQDYSDKEIQLFTESRCDVYVNCDTVSSAPDEVAFMHYVQPLYYYGGYSGSKPPSPPDPPRSSAWDFMNLFEPYERYHEPYSPSREAEEDKDQGKGKGKVIINSSDEPQSKAEKKGEKVSEAGNVVVENNDKEGGSMESEECSKTVQVEEKVKASDGWETQILLERASDSGNSILEMLDVGKLRYHKKLAFDYPYPAVSCKMMMKVFNPRIPSNPLAFKCMETSLLGNGSRRGLFKGHGSGNLCSTLKRLCMWEKKLYHEVKAEEKLRILHQNKCRHLRRMNKMDNANAQKVESLKTFIGILATKMKISIQVVDRISNTICKLREQELWPQISRFIHMFLGMWKDMAEFYRWQYKEFAEAKTLDKLNRELGNADIDAAIKLKSEVQKWKLSLSDWIHAQKCYVKALNGWLVRCLLYDPEEVADHVDGTAIPISPGKIGAPPVFVICNKWSRAVDNLSEKNVTDAVNGFMLRLNQMLEKYILDQQQKLTLEKEIERKVKVLKREEQKMQKIVKSRERKMVPTARDEIDTVSLQSALKQIFAAMERFTAITAGSYQELCKQINNQDNNAF